MPGGSSPVLLSAHVTTPSVRRLVLVADPFEDGRAMLGLLLASAGFVTVECDGGPAVIEQARRCAPDAIVLSTSARDDGTRTVWALKHRTETRNVPVILVSGHVLVADRARALSAGCDGYLPMPVDLELLLAELQRILQLGPSHHVIPGDGESREAYVEASRLANAAARLALTRAHRVAIRAGIAADRVNDALASVQGARLRKSGR